MHRSSAFPLLFILSTILFHLTSSINITVGGKPKYGTIRADGGTVDILSFDVSDDHNVHIEDNGIYPPCINADSLNYGKVNGKPTLHNPNVRKCSHNEEQPGPGNINNDNPGNNPANPPCTYNSLDERERVHYNQTLYGNVEAFVFDCAHSEHETNAIDPNNLFVWIICNARDGWRGVTKFTYKNGQKGRYTIRIGDAYIIPELGCGASDPNSPTTTSIKTLTTTMTPKTAITSTTTKLPPSLTEKKPIENSKFAASEADAPGVSTATIVGCSIGGIALFAVAAVVIFLMVKKRQNEDGSGTEQGKRTNENNDEIPDEIKVESTSEVNV